MDLGDCDDAMANVQPRLHGLVEQQQCSRYSYEDQGFESTGGQPEMNTRVSVIIPVHNGEKYIERALRSIERQTRRPEEVVIVDDGSEDETLLRIEKIARDTPLRIICERQENKGAAAARNKAIREANGELLAFLDADDEMYPEFLEKAILGLYRYEQWVGCFSDRDVIDADGHHLAKDLENPFFVKIKKLARDDEFVELNDPKLFCKMVPGSLIPMQILCRRSAIEAVSGFDEDLSLTEDRLLMLRLIKREGKLGYINRSLGIWRMHNTNQTHVSNALERHRSADLLLKKLYKHQGTWNLTSDDMCCVASERRRLSSSWLYTASIRKAPETIPLALRFLFSGRVGPAVCLKAILRYVSVVIGVYREAV